MRSEARGDVWPELVCPDDGTPLLVNGRGLACARGHAWPSELNVVRMVGAGNYGEAFGLQWRTYRRTQLDSYTGTTISRDRARRCLGEECWSALHRGPAMNVLEVGCGAGRFTEVLLATGAFVTSVDLSSAVEANEENFRGHERHRVYQADVLHLPFRAQRFDLVFCLGVIQHTQHPEKTIEQLYAEVRPGGWLVIDHYTFSLSYFTKTAPLFRAVLRRLSPAQGLRWTEGLVRWLFPLHRSARHSRAAQALLSRLSPLTSYYHALPLNDALQEEWTLLDTHDALTDWYKHFRTRNQIRRALERVGAAEIWCEYGGNGVEARCRRALDADP